MKTTLKLLVGFLLLSILSVQLSIAFAQGTAFTYQGRLNSSGAPANGLYDFRYKLYSDPSGVTQIGSNYLTSGIPVTNGLFTAAIDFGTGIFNGSNYWLEVDVRANGVGSYTPLTPLQAVTPAPYAIYAETAGNVSGTISSANLSGTYNGPVTFNNGLDEFNGTFSGQFFGPLFVGGSFSGSHFGDGSGLYNLNPALLSGPIPLSGLTNAWKTTGNAGTTPGVNFVGTSDNQPLELHVNGQRAFELFPDLSTNAAPDIVGGSSSNSITLGLVGTTISGGSWNTIGPAALFSSNNPYGDNPSYPTIGASFTTIGGGFLNQIQSGATFSTVAGGAINTIQTGDIESTISGGFHNTILSNGLWSFIGGGTYHTIASDNGVIGGGWNNSIQTNSGYATIAGGFFNNVQGNSIGSVIGGGYNNIMGPDGSGGGGAYSTIGGGYFNQIYEYYSFIGGGQQNIIQPFADHSVIGGGFENIINGSLGPVYGVIGGGAVNLIQTNVAYSVIGGGYNNIILSNTTYAAIPGGFFNTAGGNGSFAAGTFAQATNSGAFVWSDTSTNVAFNSTSSNQFLVRAAGGVGIGTNSPAAALHVMAPGSGTNTALRIANGGIAVSGAGIGTATAAFTVLTSITNTGGDSVFINNPLCNGDSNALLFVTHSYNPPNGTTATYFNKNFGVWYTGFQWAIYTEDTSPMPTNIAFNVLIIKR